MTTTLARNTDPATSHLAARTVLRSRKHDTDRRRILEVVQRWPGLTAHQIGKMLGFPPPSNVPVSRRMSSLRDVIQEGPPVKCPESGRHCTTYWPAGRLPLNT